jgi:hypothetical protein
MANEGIYVFPENGGTGNRSSLDPNLLLAFNQNGGFGNGAMWMWPMFMWMMMPWLFNGGYGGFGGMNGGANLLGTGFLSNQLNNNQGIDTLLQAINGRADAASQLAQLTHSSLGDVQNALTAIQSAVTTVAGNLGMTSQQVINSVLTGDANLSRQLCECCCENRLGICQQTNTLQQDIFGAQTNLKDAIVANGFASQMGHSNIQHSIDMAGADSRLAVCQQTNALENQATSNTQAIVGAIADLKTSMTKEFCDVRERELQSKINTQSDIITQLRGQIDNDRQTAQLYSAIAPIQNKVNEIASHQPNTVPVQWPNLTAVNNTPYAPYTNFGYGYGYGYPGGNTFWN